MNRHIISTLLCFLSFGGMTLQALDKWDQWALEGDLSGAAALASQSVKDQGKTGLSSGLMVRFGRNDTWDTGFGYNVISLQNSIRLRPATLVADRRFNPWGAWAPFLRLGAGLSADQSSGALNRLVARGGVGLRRSFNNHWDVGLKSELWYSPRSAETGNDMMLITAGVTLSRSFARALPTVKIVNEPVLNKTLVIEPTPPGRNDVPVQVETIQKPVPSLTTPPKPIHFLFPTEGWELAKSDVEAKEKDLETMAQFLVAHPSVPAEIHGHADSTGPLGYNIALSRRRAEALRDLFVKRWGIESNRFDIFAHGSKNPVASNGTPIGRAKNRRAVVILLFEGVP